MEGMSDQAYQFLNGLYIQPKYHLLVLLGLASIVSLFIGLLFGLQRGGKGGRSTPLKTNPSDRDQLRMLNYQIKTLREQSNRYRYMLLNVPQMIKRLNTTADPDALGSLVVQVASEIIHADIVHLYSYSKERDSLRKVFTLGPDLGAVEIPAASNTTVGRAARNLMTKSEAKTYAGFGDDHRSGTGEKAGHDGSGITMAAPLRFEEELIGILAVGRLKNPTGDEIGLLKMISEIAAVSLFNRAFLGDAKKEAITDPLTGLYNRRHFLEKTKECVKNAIMTGSPISFFIFDIDNFKNYNDTNGHDAGDNLLKDLSAIVADGSRKSTVIARYGGEEFIVMLPGSIKEDAVTYANRLRERIADHPFAHREKQPLGMLSISGGVASYPIDGGSTQEVIRLADAALFRAKNGGRNRVESHSPLLVPDEGEEKAGSPH